MATLICLWFTMISGESWIFLGLLVLMEVRFGHLATFIWDAWVSLQQLLLAVVVHLTILLYRWSKLFTWEALCLWIMVTRFNIRLGVIIPFYFLTAIAALYRTMSVCPSVGRSVCWSVTNEFQS